MKNEECRSEMRPSGVTWMRAIRYSLFVIFLAALLVPVMAFSQSSNRWLFIFNTSAAMRDRADGVLAVTQDLLTSGMHGNLRAGDTIGIWTYNNELRADEAPLQTWSPEAAPGIAANTLQFLSRHKYEKPAAFGDVLVNMLRVIKMSDVITVVLISDGSDPMVGTPFDERLNAFYKKNYQSQRKQRMPIITVIRGERGQILTNTLALAPWPVDIPAVPPPVVAKAAPPKSPPPPPAPPKPVPSLVIIGTKAETTFHPPSDLPEHVDVPSAPAPTPAKPVETKPTEPPAETAKAEAPPVTPEPTAAPKTESTIAPAAKPEPTPTVPPVAETPKPVQPSEAPVASAAATNENWTKVTAAPAQPVVETATPAPEPKELFSARNIAIASVGFTLLVVVLLLLAARNARNASRASLITRSLDREGK